MWGSAFSDLARKAQELQEQAQEAAHSFTAPASAASLFSLDAMRQHEEPQHPPTATKVDLEPVVVATPSFNRLLEQQLLSKVVTSTSHTTAAVASPKPRPPAVGKLKIPSSSSSKNKEGNSFTSVEPVSKVISTTAVNVAQLEIVVDSGMKDVPTDHDGEDASKQRDGSDAVAILESEVSDMKIEPQSDTSAEDNTSSIEESTPEAEENVVVLGGSSYAAPHDERLSASMAPEERNDSVEVASRELSNDSIVQTDDKPNVESTSNDQIHESQPLDQYSDDVGGSKSNRDEEMVLVASDADQNVPSAVAPMDGSSPPTPPIPQEVNDADDESDTDASNGNDRATPPPIHMDRSVEEMDGHNEKPIHFDGEASREVVPDHLLEQFSQQLQRLEANFQAERVEWEQQHQLELQQLKESFNHDACQANYRELEERLQQELHLKDDQLHELARRNEGLKLKMDVLKREVTGTQQLLEAKDGDIGKVSSNHQRALEALEQRIQEAQRSASTSQQEADRQKLKLVAVENDFNTLKQEHADLKARVKAVATELKDRRVECRELKSLLDDRAEENGRLESELERLRFQLSEKEKTRGETDEEMEQLRAQVVDLKLALESANKVIAEKESQAEKVLAEYKRKAQNSLSLANSRAAAAVQAKEEAELEARAARSTADTAMDRAVTAELSSKAAVAEAKASIKRMEEEKNEALASLERATAEVGNLSTRLSETEGRLGTATDQQMEAASQLKEAKLDLHEAKSRIAVLESELEQAHARSNVLRDDVATLRDQLHRAEAARQAAEQEVKDADSGKPGRTSEPDLSRSTDDATVRILQEDLREANHAIEDLKEALANSLALNEKYEKSGTDGNGFAASPKGATRAENGDSSSTPLFYAMEKQAELNTARDEIMRLANMLSNVQSEKTEALELKEEMRHRMEEAEARLQRYEKLAAPSGAHPDGGRHINGGSSTSSGAVNIEYLKNIMLRYLNAKTVSERKALVPVIGAVLCLTSDEQNRAVRALEESASLGGVGSSLFDTFSSKLR